MNKKILLIIIILVMAGLAIAATKNRSIDGVVSEDGIIKPSEIPADWEVLIGDGLSFSYPPEFGTNFITPRVWPPQGYVLSVGGSLPCGKADTQPAMMYKKIGSNEYCVTEVKKETSGGLESQYAYTFKSKDTIVAFILSLRYLPCDKMAADRKAACEKERAEFRLDEIVNKIASTFTLGKLEAAPVSTTTPKGS